MFESDDYDQVLSQLEIPELNPISKHISLVPNKSASINNLSIIENFELPVTICRNNDNSVQKSDVLDCKKIPSPKYMKRKMLNTHFNQKNKRKFPGPAGLLEGTCDDTICEMEILSQDINTSQVSNYQTGVFETPLWVRLLEDIHKLSNIDTIKSIKQQALEGNLRMRKAEVVCGLVESIDRSAVDPLITLRDTTGQIKCTLHRDAWTSFSAYILSEYCAFVLYKPTVLTTGSAVKKHYLNITIRNILHIYSSMVLNDADQDFPNGFVKQINKDMTIISSQEPTSGFYISPNNEEIGADLLEGLEGAFTEEMF
ncbi:unnamed protein product [Leptidea sinapis]|uniref:Homologous recombination OB-fold protein OB-fold domain-containing protein n=1 Tax=Leptidea sinapis TaxID=189913 RepID=A0A5E4Q3K9_9NEOP|nr:unnamed protein product [Leptidea sinapis]